MENTGHIQYLSMPLELVQQIAYKCIDGETDNFACVPHTIASWLSVNKHQTTLLHCWFHTTNKSAQAFTTYYIDTLYQRFKEYGYLPTAIAATLSTPVSKQMLLTHTQNFVHVKLRSLRYIPTHWGIGPTENYSARYIDCMTVIQQYADPNTLVPEQKNDVQELFSWYENIINQDKNTMNLIRSVSKSKSLPEQNVQHPIWRILNLGITKKRAYLYACTFNMNSLKELFKPD